MFYRLLGMVVWNGAKVYFRRKYGGRAPSRLIAALGGALVVGTVAAVLAARRGSGSEE
jgi:hypothetical protein